MTDRKLNLYAALVLRVSLGTVFVAHALLKILVFTPAGTVAFFDALGLPALLAYAVIALELAGGVALLLGFGTRAVSLALIPVLIGTIVLVHGDKGWLFANEGGGWEYPAFLIMASLVQALLGDGAWALGASRPAPGREPDPA
ncbi:MAG: DoxX family protein [Gammaproteobacteria bacterium]|jgi:putative oxidoreductase